MKKHFYLTIFFISSLLYSNNSFAQNKKEQIVILQTRIDSLINASETERNLTQANLKILDDSLVLLNKNYEETKEQKEKSAKRLVDVENEFNNEKSTNVKLENEVIEKKKKLLQFDTLQILRIDTLIYRKTEVYIGEEGTIDEGEVTKSILFENASIKKINTLRNPDYKEDQYFSYDKGYNEILSFFFENGKPDSTDPKKVGKKFIITYCAGERPVISKFEGCNLCTGFIVLNIQPID